MHILIDLIEIIVIKIILIINTSDANLIPTIFNLYYCFLIDVITSINIIINEIKNNTSVNNNNH